MQFGVSVFFQNMYPDLSDAELCQRELDVAVLAEQLGFDFVNSPEHHFSDHSVAPDNVQLLTWLAARTSRIKLMTAAVILPWHSPLRVAEQVAMLDNLSNGRLMFGIGRGLSLKEYGGFGIDMSESRARFDESAEMILRALKTGEVFGDGPMYPQPRTSLRPAPAHSFVDRVWSVAGSPTSVDRAADLGAHLLSFALGAPEDQVPVLAQYNARFQEVHGRDGLTPLFSDFWFCHKDPVVAQDAAEQYFIPTFRSNMEHYSMAGDHFAKTPGYEAYADAADAARGVSVEEGARAANAFQPWGTPADLVERILHRAEVLGDHDFVGVVTFGGLPHSMAAESMKLIATEVIPVVRRELGAVAVSSYAR
jgi:alkanesulfonate monooxygenase SsuD/methylene tetrahydromethanopterin reductase-like flavin-dependent oxidoreductase (luciferase family)